MWHNYVHTNTETPTLALTHPPTHVLCVSVHVFVHMHIWVVVASFGMHLSYIAFWTLTAGTLRAHKLNGEHLIQCRANFAVLVQDTVPGKNVIHFACRMSASTSFMSACLYGSGGGSAATSTAAVPVTVKLSAGLADKAPYALQSPIIMPGMKDAFNMQANSQ